MASFSNSFWITCVMASLFFPDIQHCAFHGLVLSFGFSVNSHFSPFFKMSTTDSVTPRAFHTFQKWCNLPPTITSCAFCADCAVCVICVIVRGYVIVFWCTGLLCEVSLYFLLYWWFGFSHNLFGCQTCSLCFHNLLVFVATFESTSFVELLIEEILSSVISEGSECAFLILIQDTLFRNPLFWFIPFGFSLPCLLS